MSRDHKNTPKPVIGRQSKPSAMPGVILGLFIGLIIAGVVAFYTNKLKFDSLAKEADPQSTGVVSQIASEPELLKPIGKEASSVQQNYTFYKILTGQEDAKIDASAGATQSGSDPIAKFAIQANSESSAPVIPQKTWLQVGSFQNEEDADNMKAKLVMLGMEATIQSVDLGDRGMYHRVRIGPFANSDEMARAKSQLSQNGIDSVSSKIRRI